MYQGLIRSGSDVHYWKAGRIGDYVVESPLVLGHESAGVVDAVGADVKGLEPGTRVAIEPGLPCRVCESCISGAYNRCPDVIFAATPPVDGTLARYYVTRADNVFPLADSMSMDEGAACEPLSVAIHAIKQCGFQPQNSIIVFGCGPVGLLCQAVAKAYGASKVVAVDIQQTRVDFAKSYAATDTFISPKPNPELDALENASAAAAKLVESAGLGEGAHCVIDATGAAACIQMGLFALRRGGTLAQAGMGAPNILLPVLHMMSRELSFTTCFRYAGTYPRAIDLIGRGLVDVKPIISHHYSFDKAEEAFVKTASGEHGVIKVVIDGPE